MKTNTGFNSLETMYSLVEKGLAKSKINGNLITFKYSKKVMYDYLWKKYPELLEVRGHTYDLTTGKLVIAAPRKSFNYLEDGWWSDVELNTPVILYKKYNGFMCTVAVHNNQLVFATTGTTDSDYVKMARQYFIEEEQFAIDSLYPNCTYLYEIVDENDPHIVNEEIGAKYLGYRDNETGVFNPFNQDALTIEGIRTTLGEAIEMLNEVRHEGFMCYRADDMSQVCKLKSPYYVGKKKLMRANKSLVEQMYNDTGKFISTHSSFVYKWFNVIVKIVQTIDKELWLSYTDQQRRAVIEDIEVRILIGG